MDFFDYQDQARRNTGVLLVYFGLAITAIVTTIYFVITMAFLTTSSDDGELAAFELFSLDRFVLIAGAVLMVITLSSLYKIAQLSRGGRAVAELLGGRPIDPNTQDRQQRQVLNVVEEMAIAAGLPVPTVYLLNDEQAINAFAAGFSPSDAVIGVTRGTVDLLSRDELQGVIAHEFSHIFNADMRLNMRLMGLLHGILVIALIGYYVMRFTAGGDKKGNALVFLGLALMAIGYTGVFFGRLIQSAVSRQREYLADASAVQFTRNADGLAGALKKIGGLVHHSTLASPQAQEAGHFLFAKGFSGWSLGSTHPPLVDRIRRIDSSFDGIFPEVVHPNRLARRSRQRPKPPAGARGQPLGKAGQVLFPLLSAEVLAIVGTLTQAHISYARHLLANLPKRVRDSAHDPPGARAVVVALLLDKDPSTREAQLEFVSASADRTLLGDTQDMFTLLGSMPLETRLPLVDLTLPALRRLSDRQFQAFDALVDQVIRADRRLDLFEFTLRRVLRRHLDPAFRKFRGPRVDYRSLAKLERECSYLVSALAHAGHVDADSTRRAFQLGQAELPEIALRMTSRDEAGIGQINDALDKLNRLSAQLKRKLMRACSVVVAHDGKITLVEGELLRAVADTLGLPLPPFIAGQSVSDTPTATEHTPPTQ